MEKAVQDLKRVLVAGNPILFTGAGFSKGGFQKDNRPIADGNTLKKELIEKILLIESNSNEYHELMESSLSSVCEYCATTLNKSILDDFLVDIYSECKPATFHKIFSEYKWSRIYTTNIDDLLENSFPANTLLIQNINRPKTIEQADRIEYLKLHGCVRNPTGGFVFTSRDYIDSMLKSRDYRFNQFGMDIQYRNFIFIGTDYNESDLDYYLMLYQQNASSAKGKIFFINPKISLVLSKKIEYLGGYIIKWTTEEFANFLKEQILSLKNQDTNETKEIEGFFAFSEKIETLKRYKAYRSNLYLGYEPKWEDILNDWDFCSANIQDNFNMFLSHITTKSIKHSIFSLVGKTMSGKSVFLKRLGLQLHAEGYQVYDFIGRRFNYYSFIQNARMLPVNKFCLLIDNASYYYGALRTLLRVFPKHKELIILTSSRPFFHSRKRYNLVTENFYEYYIENGIDEKFALEIDNKLNNHGYLGYLKKYTKDERIKIINKLNDIPSILFNITYGKGFYKRFQTELASHYKYFSESGKDLLVTLAIFDKLDLAYLPLEVFTLIYQKESKKILSEIEDFILYNNVNGIELRNSYLVSEILSRTPYLNIIDIVKQILVNISPQIAGEVPSYWSEIQSSLMKEKLLRRKLNLKTSAIRNMLFDIQNYYNDDYNYWIQVGISEQIEGEYEKALNHFRQAEALYPDSYMVRNAIARNFLKQANSYNDIIHAKPYFDEGESLMLALIEEREEFQVKAFSTHCYLYEKINYCNKFHILPSDRELKDMFSLLKTILDKDGDDGMAKHISNKLFTFLKTNNKTKIIDINFYDLSSLKSMFEQYDIDIESLFEDFELDD